MNVNELATAFRAGIDQTSRLLKLDTPLGSNALVPVRAVGSSRVGRNFDFTVDVASLQGDVELKTLIAKPVTLWMLQQDQSYLPHHGYVHSARRLGSDGSLTNYQIAFSSWMHFLKFRKDARIFQDKTVEDILVAVFNGHPQAQGAFRFDLQASLPNRSFCVQYEDDWNFVHRLMESAGLFCFFEQAKDGKSHTVVVTDNLYSFKTLTPQQVDYYRAGTGAEADGIVQWGGARTLQSSAYSTRTFDYKSPDYRRDKSVPTVDNQGDLPEQTEVYEYTGAYSYSKSEDGDVQTRSRMEEWESRAKRFYGTGSVRHMDSGRWFQLDGAPGHETDTAENREFAVLATTWYVENNVPVSSGTNYRHSLQQTVLEVRSGHAGALDTFQAKGTGNSTGFFLVEIEAQRRKVPFRSPFEHRKPVMHMQTATVVGPANEEVYTDPTNRVKVLMHWDRESAGKENSSCWMRVVMSSNGGADSGGVYVPRVGQEVVVNYLDGDCDRPVITGTLHNGRTTPQWHTNGLLSGYKSREYQGQGYNQLVFDDATGQNRAQLYSSTAQTYLHIGYLIDQNGNTRGNYLGTGFDLKTESYGAVRASQGMYLSTYARGGAASQPLDVKEAHQHLVESGGVVERRSEVATGSQAEGLQDAQDTINEFATATQNPQQSSVNGGNTAGGGTGEANGFSQPVMLFASPSGIGLSTQKSIQAAATEHVNIVSGASTHIAATRSLIASVGEKLSLFVQNSGMKLFAGKGKLELQAQSDNIELTADRTLKVISVSDAVEVQAQKEICLKVGGATLRMANGNIYIHSPGLVEIKGAQHSFQGPASQNAAAQLPVTEACAQKFASASQVGAAIVD